MEVIRGGELLDLLIDGGVYTEKDAARCMKQVFLAISYLHSQVKTNPLDRARPQILFSLIVSLFGRALFTAISSCRIYCSLRRIATLISRCSVILC